MPLGRGRTVCFIDNSNIFHGQQSAGWRIEWQRFVQHFEQHDQIWQTYFFASVQDPPRAAQEGFYKYLKEQLRWEVVLYSLGTKTVTCNNCGHSEMIATEKGADVGVATKMLMLGMNKAYDTALLVSGDRDYLETVKFIKNLGLRIEVIAWRSGLSNELAAESSAPIVYLDDIKSQIEKV